MSLANANLNTLRSSSEAVETLSHLVKAPLRSGGRRTRRACDRCRVKKSKCNGQQPCSTCESNDRTCVFSALRRRDIRKWHCHMQDTVDEAIQRLYQACKAGSCFPGVLPEEMDGHVTTENILHGMGFSNLEIGPHAMGPRSSPVESDLSKEDSIETDQSGACLSQRRMQVYTGHEHEPHAINSGLPSTSLHKSDMASPVHDIYDHVPSATPLGMADQFNMVLVQDTASQHVFSQQQQPPSPFLCHHHHHHHLRQNHQELNQTNSPFFPIQATDRFAQPNFHMVYQEPIMGHVMYDGQF